jgi:phage FluMu protein Com
MSKCKECWEVLAQYSNSNEINCENPTCKLWGLNQIGIELEEWEVA